MPSKAELDQLDGEATETISNRVRTVAFGTMAVAWAFAIGDIPEGVPTISHVHLAGPIVLALISIFLDYIQYFFKYRTISVHRQRLSADQTQDHEETKRETLVAVCKDIELKLSETEGQSVDNKKSWVEWDPTIPSYRLVHVAFWWKQVFVIVASCWLIVSLGAGLFF